MIPSIALEISVVCLGIFLLLFESFIYRQDKRYLAWIATSGIFLILVASFFTAQPSGGADSNPFYVHDAPGIFFKRFMLVATALTVLLAVDFTEVFSRYIPSERKGAGVGEFYILPIFVCAGLMWMTTAADFIMIFVALELVTIGFYVLVASMRKNKAALEAGVKYLILGALSTGFFVYGLTWIFGTTGQTSLQAITEILPELSPERYTGLLFGFGLVMVALGFKIAAFPFQFWVADVYQGAATPVTAFLSVASKAAGFIVLIRIIEPFLEVSFLRDRVLTMIYFLAGATMLYGNLAAMPQNNLKRLLAYSSISHAGFLLLGVASVYSGRAGQAVAFYLASYLLMTFSAFAVLIIVSRNSLSDEISDFNGLFKRSPSLALALMISMLSLAGVPLTAGFLGKFFIFESALSSELFLLVVIGIVAVGCGYYYYFKVIRAIFWQAPAEGASPLKTPTATSVTLAILSTATILFGIFPQPIFLLMR